MKLKTIIPYILTAGLPLCFAVPAASVPGSYPAPTADNFPHPDDQQLRHIETEGDGLVNITNAFSAQKLSPQDVTFLQLVVFNEYFETAFFNSLIHNVTIGVAGFEYDKKDELVAILKDILAQEEIHALSAIDALKANKAFVPSPCRYEFGSTSLQHAINFAQVFTTIFMGTLQDMAVSFAQSGDKHRVRAITAVIANEAEQAGYFRHMLAKKPSAHPFPTTSIASFLFSALNIYTVPGSCPFPLSNIDIPIFRPFVLNGVGMIKPADQTLSFTTNLGGVDAAARYMGKNSTACESGNESGLYVTYVTAQLAPISVPATNLRWNGTSLTVDAQFPYTKYLMTGLSLAALTTKANFADVDEIPGFTLAAPAVMQADHYLNAQDKLGALE